MPQRQDMRGVVVHKQRHPRPASVDWTLRIKTALDKTTELLCLAGPRGVIVYLRNSYGFGVCDMDTIKAERILVEHTHTVVGVYDRRARGAWIESDLRYISTLARSSA